jgi:predicted phosphodiesterase
MSVITLQKHTTPVFKKHQPDDSYKFQPLPEPTGSYPYRLSIDKVIPGTDESKLVFQMVGDTGSIRSPDFQKLVAGQMEKQFLSEDPADRPKFLYHLGDVVYNFGEEEQYPRQFFGPYEAYPAPIFAIAGNHDSEVNPDNPVPYKSLDAFKKVFCDTESRTVEFSRGSARKSMTQPNVYWTLETPLATIIGMHGNVTKYGTVTAEQRSWFIEELKAADLQRPHKAVIVCMHHAPYSADFNHGASISMIEFFNHAFEEAGARPDIVLSGHVHNYQRFSRQYTDGGTVPFIVAGAGGYDELHGLAPMDEERYTAENELFDSVKLENYCDNKHGFLKMSVERIAGKLVLTGEYYTIPHEKITEIDSPAALADRFVIRVG